MVLVSNDPSWWPVINANVISSYFIVAASVGVMYDWGLTFGQEVELIWRQRWSLMTLLYLSVRYVGIRYAVMFMLATVPIIPMTDAVGRIVSHVTQWMGVVVNAILGVIMIIQLHAMYQQSRKVFVFLVVIFLAIKIANAVMVAIMMTEISEGDVIWDCFTVLIRTHISYFASFLAISCFHIGVLSPMLSILQYVQMFVLGPCLILGVQEYHAELVANSDTATAMTSIAFQECNYVSTSSSV
ncbi:hypothetical protein BDR07DRAFT_1372981 [Suillus spraguei]|nr:hypothetical protein BDR07DRAFT_1372981 [Suillus spraguei]